MDDKEDRKRKVKQSFENGTFDYDKAVETWPQCCHFMRHKKRFCNVQRAPNSKYCGTHRPPDEDSSSSKRLKQISDKSGFPLTRCPCPIDPSHTIYIANLDKHIQICNIKTRNDLLMKEPYYQENCNSGLDNEQLDFDLKPHHNSNSQSSSEQSQGMINTNALIEKVRNAFKNVQTDYFENPHDQSKHVNITHENIKTNIMSESNKLIELTVLTAVADGQSADSNLRHAQQDYFIILQMIKFQMMSYSTETTFGLINDTSSESYSDRAKVFIELGAGKGMLGLAVHSVQPESTIVLVERSGAKRKADKLLRVRQGSFYRARMDIRHCLISELPGVGMLAQPIDFNNLPKHDPPVVFPTSQIITQTKTKTKKSIVVIAKHLCGCATDMAIRSLAALDKDCQNDVCQKGLAIATCCHHACNWKDYTGKAWYLGQGFTVSEFDILKHWSGWAHTLKATGGDTSEHRSTHKTDGNYDHDTHIITSLEDDVETDNNEETNVNEQSNNSPSKGTSSKQNQGNISSSMSVPRPKDITRKEMALYGWMIKRILDHGRVNYLRDFYKLQANQVQYCETNLSPENIMLIAT